MKQRHKETLFLAGILIAIAVLAALSAKSTESEKIKYGRKDLLRNELIVDVISSNNELFKEVLKNNQSTIVLLNDKIVQLEEELRVCNAKNK